MALRVTLVTGGIRSGKSAVAEKLVSEFGSDIAYLASGEPSDPEMERRIDRHRARRPSGWITVEVAGCDLPEAIASLPSVDGVLLDDLGGVISRLTLREASMDEVGPELESLDQRTMGVLDARDLPVVVVTSEVGLTLVSTSRMGRQFTDLLGESNQRWASVAESVYLVVAGQSLRIK